MATRDARGEQEAATGAAGDPDATGPLHDLTVLDLTRVLAGPFCTMLLADLGARVIKVEPPGGDDARHFGPFVEGESAYFASLNRGKESLVLDLKTEDGRALFEELLARADILVENFRPGAMERLGFGWERLHSRYPRLIYVAASGFGHSGPYRDRPAYDLVVQAMGGIMSLTGHPGGAPTRVGTSIGDIAAGLFAAVGIGAALHHRARTGEGMMVDLAMFDCQAAILENALARYFATGEVPGPLGARHPSITPFDAFATADGHLVLAAGNDSLFQRLCETVGRPDLSSDPRFATNPDRTRRAEELKRELEGELRKKPTAEWQKVMDGAGIPNGPINDVAAVVADPQIAARNMIVEAMGASGADLRMAGNPIKMSAFADPERRGPVPRLDEHRGRILEELDVPENDPGRS